MPLITRATSTSCSLRSLVESASAYQLFHLGAAAVVDPVFAVATLTLSLSLCSGASSVVYAGIYTEYLSGEGCADGSFSGHKSSAQVFFSCVIVLLCRRAKCYIMVSLQATSMSKLACWPSPGRRMAHFAWAAPLSHTSTFAHLTPRASCRRGRLHYQGAVSPTRYSAVSLYG